MSLTSGVSTDIRGFRVSPGQRRLWTLREADGGEAYRHVCAVHVPEGDAVRLAAVFSRTVARYEILRTTLGKPEGMKLPLQVIRPELPALFEARVLSSPEELESALGRAFEEALWAHLDPEDGPVLRAVLLTAPGEAVLVLAVSALCLDLSGVQGLLRELSLGSAGVEPEGEPLQFADLAEWQCQALEGEESRAGREIWQRRWDPERLAPRLPWSRRPAPGLPFEPAAVAGPVSPSLARDLEALLKSRGLSWQAALLTAWAALLARLTGRSDLIVGCAFDGRDYEELRGALGPLARVVPVRLDIPAEARWIDLAGAVEEALREARTWQECFDWEEVAGPPDPISGPTCCPFAFELQEETPSGWRIVRQRSCGDRFEVRLTCRRGAGVLETGVDFDPQVLDERDAERLLERLQTLLAAAVRSPEAAVEELECVPAAEQSELLDLGRGGEVPPAGACVHHWFEEQARARPDATALICGGARLSFGELNDRANRLARHLRRLGVGPEVPVVLCLERTPALLVALLAVLKAGGFYVPLDPAQPSERLSLMLADCGAPVVLSEERLAASLSAPAATLVRVDADAARWAAESGADLGGGAAPGNAVYAIFTSGSSGAPKSVVVEHRQLAAYVRGVGERLDLPEGASYASVSTVAADLGNTALFPALCTGGCLHLVDLETAADPEALADLFQAEPVDCLKIVPSHLRALLRGSRPAAILPRRRLVLGGESTTWELFDELEALAGPECEILDHYGPTETTVGVLTWRSERGWPLPESATLPLGKPLAGARVLVLDSGMRLAPAGAPGELFVGGAGVTRGYAGRPDLTAERFLPDPFADQPGARLYRTGDRVRVLPSGDVEFLGRVDRQVKIHGFRVEPGEVEAILARHPGVAQAVVIAREEGEAQRLVTYLVARGEERPPAAELREYLRERLPEVMVPSAFVWLDALPLTGNGKLDRGALPAPELAAAGAYVAPRHRAEEILARIWEEVLGIERVGVYDNFFELGGDSILSIQIVARANRFGLRLSPKQVFQHQTVAGLAEVAGGGAVAAEQGPVTGPCPLTPIQRRFFAEEPVDPHHYNQAVLLQPAASLTPALLEAALALLPRQHDALRLRFRRGEEGWSQEIAPAGPAEPLLLADLSELPASLGAVALEEVATQIHASLALESGPLWRPILFDLGAEAGWRLLLVAHHLTVDTVSWRILLQDLETACGDLSEGREPRLPAKTTSYKSWAGRLQEHALSAALHEELAVWAATASPEPLRLPVEEAAEATATATARTVSVTLEGEEAAALLREASTGRRGQVQEALLAALATALAPWVGEGLLPLELEGHGREDIFPDVDLSRTVGWFTSVYPVSLRLVPGLDATSVLPSVQAALDRVPGHGFGFGLLRYLSPEGARSLSHLPAAEVRFNYLGHLGQAHSFDAAAEGGSLFPPAWEGTGPAVSPRARRRYLLDISAAVRDGRLWVGWTYSEGALRRQTVEQLADAFLASLRSLAAGPAQPAPEDFPLARLSRQDLDRILGKAQRELT